MLAGLATGAVWAFAIIIAVNQLGIATTLVNTLLMATVGALALAFGLAFGLGGKETAGEMLREWREKAKEAAPKIKAAAEAAKQNGPEEARKVYQQPPSQSQPGRPPIQRAT